MPAKIKLKNDTVKSFFNFFSDLVLNLLFFLHIILFIIYTLSHTGQCSLHFMHFMKKCSIFCCRKVYTT